MAAGSALLAAGLVALFRSQHATVPPAKERVFTLVCDFVTADPIRVEVWTERGLVKFDSGPTLKIQQVTSHAGGGLQIRAGNETHEFFASIEATASVRVRTLPGDFEELVCPAVETRWMATPGRKNPS